MAPLIQVFCGHRVFFVLLLVALAHVCPARPADSAGEHEVQAMFLLNLTRFIRWPESAFTAEDDPLVIGCLPNDRVGALLIDAARGEMAGKHPISVRQIRTSADLEGCHAVFFSKSDMGRVAQMIGPLRTKPMLTVSDAEGFLRLGGHVQLYNRAGQVRLRLDLRNLKRSEFGASASLLRVSEVTGI